MDKNERGKARFEEFTDAVTSLARNVLEDVRDEQIKTILTECVNAHNARNRVKPLKDKKIKEIREALIETIVSHMKPDLEEGFEEFNISEIFQLLLEMQDKRNRETKAWRPPLDPQEHMAALRVAEKQQLLAQYEILVSMKRRQVDLLKDQFKEKKASCDLTLARTKLDEVSRKIEVIHDLNEKFNHVHEKVVDCITNHEVSTQQAMQPV